MASSGCAQGKRRLHLNGRAGEPWGPNASVVEKISLSRWEALEIGSQTRSGPAEIALSDATEIPARASDARVRSANTSKSCKSPRFERQCAVYKCITGDLQYDISVIAYYDATQCASPPSTVADGFFNTITSRLRAK